MMLDELFEVCCGVETDGMKYKDACCGVCLYSV